MRKLVGALALLMAVPGGALAMPEATVKPAEGVAEAKLLELTGPLTENIGEERVILLYGEFDRDDADPGFRFGVRYGAPEAGKVILQSDRLAPIVHKVFGTIVEAWKADPHWFNFTMVIDHGEATIEFQKAEDLGDPDPADFNERFDETAKGVFPGLEIQPYTPGY